MRLRVAATVLALAMAGLVAATPVVAKSKAHQMTAKTAQADYLKDVAPVNTALSEFVAAAHWWTGDTTAAQAEVSAQPLVAAVKKFQVKLEDSNWPKSNDRTAADSLAVAAGGLNASLETLSTVNFLNDEEWLQSFDSAENTLGVAANVMRHALGLLPAS
jgi:hypothetical protein